MAMGLCFLLMVVLGLHSLASAVSGLSHQTPSKFTQHDSTAETGSENEERNSKDAERGRAKLPCDPVRGEQIGKYQFYKRLLSLTYSTGKALQFLLPPDYVDTSMASLNRTSLVRTFFGSAEVTQTKVNTKTLPASPMSNWCNFKTELILQHITLTCMKLQKIKHYQHRLLFAKTEYCKAQRIAKEDCSTSQGKQKLLAIMKANSYYAKQMMPIRQFINATYHKMRQLPPPTDEDLNGWMKNVQLVKAFVNAAIAIVRNRGPNVPSDQDSDGREGLGHRDGRQGSGGGDELKPRASGHGHSHTGDGHTGPRGGGHGGGESGYSKYRENRRTGSRWNYNPEDRDYVNRDRGKHSRNHRDQLLADRGHEHAGRGETQGSFGRHTLHKPKSAHQKPKSVSKKLKDAFQKSKSASQKLKDASQKLKDAFQKLKDAYQKPTSASQNPKSAHQNQPTGEWQKHKGERQQPKGVRQQPKGVRQQPKGAKQQPTGVKQQPKGAKQQPTGVRQQPTGERQQPTGERQQPTGAKQQPKGARQQPKGARQQPKGARQQPKGARQQPKGARQQPNGARQQPKGARQQPKGARQQPTGDQGPRPETKGRMGETQRQPEKPTSRPSKVVRKPSNPSKISAVLNNLMKAKYMDKMFDV